MGEEKADLRAVYIDYGILTEGMEMGIKDAKKIQSTNRIQEDFRQ